MLRNAQYAAETIAHADSFSDPPNSNEEAKGGDIEIGSSLKDDDKTFVDHSHTHQTDSVSLAYDSPFEDNDNDNNWTSLPDLILREGLTTQREAEIGFIEDKNLEVLKSLPHSIDMLILMLDEEQNLDDIGRENKVVNYRNQIGEGNSDQDDISICTDCREK